MATAKKASVTPAKKAGPVAKTATAPVKKTAKPAAAGGILKPLKTAFNKSTLVAHLAQHAAVEPKAVKAVLASLEATMLASVNKKGLGTFTLPGLLKVQAVRVPAKPRRKGLDPFTKVEKVFAAKPASIKLKTRALKKLKDAAS